MIRHGGRPADGAEQNRVHAFELRLPVVGHHLAGLRVVVATGPLDVAEVEPDAEAPRHGVEYAQRFRHDFAADAVAGNDCNAMDFVCHVVRSRVVPPDRDESPDDAASAGTCTF
jgi:hypothetical protein